MIIETIAISAGVCACVEAVRYLVGSVRKRPSLKDVAKDRPDLPEVALANIPAGELPVLREQKADAKAKRKKRPATWTELKNDLENPQEASE